MAFSAGNISNFELSNTNLFVDRSLLRTSTSEAEQATSGVEKNVQENFALSENFSDKLEEYKAKTKSYQEEINYTETAKQGMKGLQEKLEKVQKELEQANKDGDYESFSKIFKKGLEEIDKISEETSFNGKNPIKESTDEIKKFSEEAKKNTGVSIDDVIDLAKKTGISDLKKLSAANKKEADVLLQKMSDAIAAAKSNIGNLNSKKQEIITEVDHNVEIKFNEVVEEVEFSADNTKESIKEDIKIKPQKALHTHVKNLSPKILLALISIQK